MIVFDKLFKPLGYIKIKHPEKTWFDLYLPLILASLITIVFAFLPKPITLIGKDGLISLVNGILQILSGFYIASMAAVATFQKEGMDDKMDGVSATIDGVDLTRRNFLTYLFGYLAFMSIAMYFFGGFIQLAKSNISYLFDSIPFFVKYTFVGFYFFIIFNILFTTVLGMHFMIDKIHREKSILINKSKK